MIILLDEWNLDLANAAEIGDMDGVKQAIADGADDWSLGLRRAAYNGHMDIVQLMINKGADDWKWGFCGAAYNGHMDIVQLIIDKEINDWDDLCEEAKDFVSRDFEMRRLNSGLIDSTRNGHMDIVRLMITKGAGNPYIWGRVFGDAMRKGYMDIAQLLIDKGGEENTIEQNTYLDFHGLIWYRENVFKSIGKCHLRKRIPCWFPNVACRYLYGKDYLLSNINHAEMRS